MINEPKVDLGFHVRGRTLPVDHGFALYGAVSRAFPVIHEDDDIAMKLIPGKYIGNGILDIQPSSELVFRLHASKICRYLELAGKTLGVLGHDLYIGIPRTRMLYPGGNLYAHLVTTRNGQDQFRFETEIGKQMEELGIEGAFKVLKRKTFQVHGKQVVGYALIISNLDPDASIILQENGLGGRRKMGCGFFEVWQGDQ